MDDKYRLFLEFEDEDFQQVFKDLEEARHTLIDCWQRLGRMGAIKTKAPSQDDANSAHEDTQPEDL